jgi:iron complex outermembrane receptor protein
MTILRAEVATGDQKIMSASKRTILATVGVMALCFGIEAAQAQEAAPTTLAQAEAPTPANEGEITVTGSRIVRDGYSSPTPVSVISTEEINREAPANISDFVNTLPSVRGSSTPTTTNGALSNGGAGISSVNLRNLGANRTLVLLDGQRSVPSDVNGTTDVNTIPQSLIERVEVVTGGASSQYGSDAVSGVVNFILNKKFKGLKADYEYGTTSYGDGQNHKASITAGADFGEHRGHVIVAGDYFQQTGIQSINRDWNDSGFFTIANPNYSAAACSGGASTCVNSLTVTTGVGSGNFTPGGLILGARNSSGNVVALTSSALASAALLSSTRAALTNTYFGTIDPATGKATTGTLSVGARSGQWMQGGDYQYASSSHVGTATLLPSEKRKSAFGRLSWDFSSALKVFGQFGYNSYQGLSYYQATPSQTTAGAPSVSTTSAAEIKIDNPYLPANVKSAMTAAGLQSIVVSTGNAGLPAQGSNMKREVFRYVAGAEGDFAVLNREFHWSGYYQKGITKTHEQLINAWNYDRMTKATDAVTAANGTIQCRVNADSDTTNDDPACVPLNRVGVGGMSPAAIAYVLGNGKNPLREQRITEDAAAINASTNNLFELPAGAVSIAFGVEHRKEKVSGSVDAFYAPQGSGSTIVPTWRYGNFIPVFGQYSVTEGYVETIVPIIKNLDFNGVIRVTDYSTSGRVETWKTGLTYQPIPDIKFRGTYSRDIRAPNLGELFNPGGGATNSVNRPTTPGQTTNTTPDTYINSVVGNTALKPEIAKTLGAGAVFTPTFLPGFAMSVDYYRIKLTGAISTYSAQNLVDLCFGDKQSAASCQYINLVGGGTATPTNTNVDIQSVTIKPLNFVGIKDEGIDIEASYRRHIGPGTTSLRALVNRALTYKSDNGISFVRNQVGENSGALPKWTYRISAAYNLDNGLGFEVIGRGISSGSYNNSYIVCTTSCPVSTTDHTTTNNNHIAGAWYFDLNADYKFTVANTKADVFFSVKNIFNKDPVLVANGPTGDNTEAYPQTNRTLYDILGTVYRMGIRVEY